MFPYAMKAIKNLFSKPSTYLGEKREAPDNYRGRIIFHPDRCINCGMCIRVCSPGAITRTIVKQGEDNHITFEFDMSSCTFCQMCSDFCTRNSIEMSKDYSMVSCHGEGIVETGTFIKKAPAPKPQPPKPAADATPEPKIGEEKSTEQGAECENNQ